MMLLIYALLMAAFALGWFGRDRLAIGFLIGCLAVAAGLFLWEIYSPVSGFAMPWISVDRAMAVEHRA
jgi:hypothetical protein